MANDSNPERHRGLSDDETEETIGLGLTFKEAALLYTMIKVNLKKNMVPFERIPDFATIMKKVEEIAKELMPKGKAEIKIYQKIPKRS